MFKFIKLAEEHLEKVMSWRIKPEVTQYMLTDVKYNLEDQHKWFNMVAKNNAYHYWIILYQDIPIGLINLAAIDRTHRHCSAGYYIGEIEYRQLGALIPPYLYNYVFKEMKFRKIYGEVIAGNKNVLQMHKIHGFREVGTYRDHIFKNGRFNDIVLVELLSESWLKQDKFRKYVANFMEEKND